RKEKCKTLFLLFLERDNDLNLLCVDVSNTFDFAQKQFRFQEWVLDVDEESNGCGGGEMEIEGIQTRTVEARTRGLVPVWGYLQSSKPQQVMRESFQSPRNTTQGDQVTPLEGHGTETEFGVVHGKEENRRTNITVEKLYRKRKRIYFSFCYGCPLIPEHHLGISVHVLEKSTLYHVI
ncbi:unnamed protein product, partial [Brassica oleracea]